MKSGLAPACVMASVVAMNVFGTVRAIAPGPIPAADQSESHRVRAAPHSDAMPSGAVRGEIALKLFHHRAADEPGGVQGAAEDGQQLVLQLGMERNQIYKGDFRHKN